MGRTRGKGRQKSDDSHDSVPGDHSVTVTPLSQPAPSTSITDANTPQPQRSPENDGEGLRRRSSRIKEIRSKVESSQELSPMQTLSQGRKLSHPSKQKSKGQKKTVPEHDHTLTIEPLTYNNEEWSDTEIDVDSVDLLDGQSKNESVKETESRSGGKRKLSSSSPTGVSPPGKKEREVSDSSPRENRGIISSMTSTIINYVSGRTPESKDTNKDKDIIQDSVEPEIVPLTPPMRIIEGNEKGDTDVEEEAQSDGIGEESESEESDSDVDLNEEKMDENNENANGTTRENETENITDKGTLGEIKKMLEESRVKMSCDVAEQLSEERPKLIEDLVKEMNEAMDKKIQEMEDKVIETVEKKFEGRFKELENKIEELFDKNKGYDDNIKKIKEQKSKISNDKLEELETQIKGLESKVKKMSEELDITVEPLEEHERCVVLHKVPFFTHENPIDVAAAVIGEMRSELKGTVKIIDAARLGDTKKNPTPLLKVALETKEQKVNVLRAKSALVNSARYKKVWARSSKTHLERAMEKNIRIIQECVPALKNYRLASHTVLVEKSQRPQRPDGGQNGARASTSTSGD